MTLLYWLNSHDLCPENGLCVTLGTDGIDPRTSQLMSISYASIEDEPVTLYVKQPTTEANATKVEPFTDVSQKEYLQKAIYFNEALEILKPILEETEFIISYAEKSFYRPWVEQVLTPLVEIPMLDLPNIFKLKDRNGVIRQDLESIEQLNESILNQTEFMKEGYSIPSLSERYLGYPYIDGLSKLEGKPKQLQLLFGLSLQLIL